MVFTAASVLLTNSTDADPTFWQWAPTPPMGWNSYDAYGSSVTEEEFLANAQYVKDRLLSHGWNYVVVDFRWSDPTAAQYNPNGKPGIPLESDSFGRLLPAPARFPSAAGGAGFKPLADKIHGMGLKFGIHVMRGIPRQSVQRNTPIEGSQFKAQDAVDRNHNCSWCQDMYGVDATKQAGKDYYNSIMRLYASWGVDFVKVDDLSEPYHATEIEAIRSAIDNCGRPIILSTSPGDTAFEHADHVSNHANMWRISSDFWDNWKSLNRAFDLAATWENTGGPGRWPDSDMIPFGRIGIRCVGKDRQTEFTRDEQVTLMSLWVMMPSPLMLGASLPGTDDPTLSLLTNDEVLAIDQDPAGNKAVRVSQTGGLEVWKKLLKNGNLAVGLFNRGESKASITVHWSELGLNGKQRVRDLWQEKDLGILDESVQQPIPKHGAVLLLLSSK